MTAFLPTTRVDVARPTGSADAWGDDTGDVLTLPETQYRRVPAAVSEDRQRSFLATEARGGIVEYLTVRLRPGTDVREGDRLTTTEGLVLQVELVDVSAPLAGMTDVRCTARRVSSRS